MKTQTRLTVWHHLAPRIYRYPDSCNVYVLKAGNQAVAIDFGSGAWLHHLSEIGVDTVDHVLLTHVHRDQMYGLVNVSRPPYVVHVPAGDAPMLGSKTVQAFWKDYQSAGCPSSYSAPIAHLDMPCVPIGEANDLIWRGGRITAIPTPGHSPGALTFLTEWQGKQVAFCGDALTAEGRVHEPYHLEWDHWTGEGANRAYFGLQRLSGMAVDLLCPSHGRVRKSGCEKAIQSARRRTGDFILAKGSVCEGERDRWHPVTRVDKQTVRVSDHLYLFGGNTYLLLDDAGSAMLIDPTLPSIRKIQPLLERMGVHSVTAATATHYHRDHSDGLNWVRDNLGSAIWLHPWVSEVLKDRNRYNVPWLPEESIRTDRRLPETGRFRWSSYDFSICPFPGQTRWHCAFDTHTDGQHVLFSGDNFQPPSRWNGTGGFCSYNGSRMDGFAQSAQTVIDLAPDLICNGHGCVYRYAASHYQKILRWASRSEKAIRALSDRPGGFDCGAHRLEPFRSEASGGQIVSVSYCVRNHAEDAVTIRCTPTLPDGWTSTPATCRLNVGPGKTRRVTIHVALPRKARQGRHVVAMEVHEDGRSIGQPAVAIVDVG